MRDETRLPARWQGWTLTEEIGAGSFGTVYKAQNQDTGEICAVKVVTILADSSEKSAVLYELSKVDSYRTYLKKLADQYASEARTMELLQEEPHIVAIRDHFIEEEKDKEGWKIYIMMEYLQSFLDYRIEHELEVSDVMRLGISICDALSACEKVHLIHGDIKPDNLFVAEDGTFKLGDFGGAGQSEPEQPSSDRDDPNDRRCYARGTFSYMSPEQYHGESIDLRTDLYSLGMVLYKLMNGGRDPFTPQNRQILYYEDRKEALKRRMDGEPLPPPAQASAALARVILKACAYVPDDRYRDAAQMKAALLEAAAAPQEPLPAEAAAGSGGAYNGSIPAGSGGAHIGSIPAGDDAANPRRKGIRKLRPWIFAGTAAAITLGGIFFLEKERTGHITAEAGGVAARSESAGREKTFGEAVWAAGQIADTLGKVSLEEDMEAFSSYFRNAREDQIEAYYVDFNGFCEYECRNIIPVTEYEGMYYVGVTGYHSPKEQTTETGTGGETGEDEETEKPYRSIGEIQSRSWGLCLTCEDNRWKIDLDPEKCGAIGREIAVSTCPEGMAEAETAGLPNHIMSDVYNYMYLDRTATYQGSASYQVKFAWQDADENLYVTLFLTNGTTKPVTFRKANVTLTDPSRPAGAVIAETTLPLDCRVEAGRNELLTFCIDAEKVNSFSWGDIIYHPVQCEVVISGIDA